MTRFWISWYEPTDEKHPNDYRPLTYPLEDAFKGWWCTGSTCEDPPQYTLCAVVDAESELEAKAKVRKFWRPSTWRFCNEQDADWMPNESRFPREETA